MSTFRMQKDILHCFCWPQQNQCLVSVQANAGHCWLCSSRRWVFGERCGLSYENVKSSDHWSVGRFGSSYRPYNDLTAYHRWPPAKASHCVLASPLSGWNVYTHTHTRLFQLKAMTTQFFVHLFICHTCAFSAPTILSGHQEKNLACKNLVTRCWHGYLSRARCKLFAYGQDDDTAIQKHHHLVSLKSRLVLPSSTGLPKLSWKIGHQMR